MLSQSIQGALLVGLLVLAGPSGSSRQPPPPPRAVANDNRTPAGTIRGGTLSVRLVVQRAEWYPEAGDGPHIAVPTLGEEGKAPSIPGPLIRVRTGTPIHATIRNALPDSTIHIIGLGGPPAKTGDSLEIQPGTSREVTFTAGGPGTYYYRAVIGKRIERMGNELETAGGALVVDPPGGSPPDRVFVMNIYAQQGDSDRSREAMAINGTSWPHTERMAMTLGDTARWRVINGTVRAHPMHLHGFYFRIDAMGSGTESHEIPADQRMLAVTDEMRPWETRTFTWSPDRTGNWLFHCHLTFHVIPDARLDHRHGPDVEIRETTAMDPMRHMAGLVLGIQVAPRPGTPDVRDAPKGRLDLFVNQGPKRGRMPMTLSYILQQGAEPTPDSVEVPGSLIVLHQGQTTDVTVHNRADEPVAIHWHGLELESWSDGVEGWSSRGEATAPPVMPADTFIARLSVPRAGTFMYHTHINDIEQVTAGAIGPLIVLEPGERYDPTRDHVYIGGWNGPEDETSPGCVAPAGGPQCGPKLMVNGDSVGGQTLTLPARVKHRFRFINLSPAIGVQFAIRRDTSVVQWIGRARDGADLPPALRKPKPAAQMVQVGQTWDFELTPEPGELVLTAGFGRGTSWRQRLIFR